MKLITVFIYPAGLYLIISRNKRKSTHQIRGLCTIHALASANLLFPLANVTVRTVLDTENPIHKHRTRERVEIAVWEYWARETTEHPERRVTTEVSRSFQRSCACAAGGAAPPIAVTLFPRWSIPIVLHPSRSHVMSRGNVRKRTDVRVAQQTVHYDLFCRLINDFSAFRLDFIYVFLCALRNGCLESRASFASLFMSLFRPIKLK